MATSLFQGAPQTATSYTTSTTETPKWMQDAIYNQIQIAQNVANTPFQPYSAPVVAELSPLQQAAYANVQANQGAGQADLAKASKGMAALTGGAGAAGAAKPYLTTAATGFQGAAGTNTSAGLTAAQNQYLSPTGAKANLASGQEYIKQAGETTAEALGQSSLDAASPYMQAASQTAAGGISGYMNPYTEGVTNRIAQLGARNLTENLLPGVSDAFIRSGTFGGSRMGEFGSRALRDTQESILGQQAAALQQGYGQALTASEADLARQANLATTAGGLSGADIGRTLTAAGQYGALGSAQTTAGQAQQTMGLTGAQAVQQAATSDAARQIAAAQGQAGLGSTAGTLTASDLTRQMGALGQVASMSQQSQAMKAADVAAMEGAGAAQQAQQQAQLNAAKAQFDAEQLYAKQQADWLSTQVRGMAPITPTSTSSAGGSTGATYSASPLSQLATGLYTYKGLNAPG